MNRATKRFIMRIYRNGIADYYKMLSDPQFKWLTGRELDHMLESKVPGKLIRYLEFLRDKGALTQVEYQSLHDQVFSRDQEAEYLAIGVILKLPWTRKINPHEITQNK